MLPRMSGVKLHIEGHRTTMSATIKSEQGPWNASSIHLLGRDGRQAVSAAGYDDEPAPQVVLSHS